MDLLLNLANQVPILLVEQLFRFETSLHQLGLEGVNFVEPRIGIEVSAGVGNAHGKQGRRRRHDANYPGNDSASCSNDYPFMAASFSKSASVRKTKSVVSVPDVNPTETKNVANSLFYAPTSPSAASSGQSLDHRPGRVMPRWLARLVSMLLINLA